MSLMQTIRNHAKGWIAWMVVIIIGIPFAFFGIQRYFGGGGEPTVAEINGTKVTLREFQRAYQEQRRRLEAALGPNFDINALDETRLRKNTLEQMIDEELVIQDARARGLTISEGQLAGHIGSLNVFRDKGTFSPERYRQWLRSQGYTSSGFEHEFRRSLLAAQVYAGVAGTAFVTPSEVNNMLRLLGQKRTYAQLTIPAKRFSDVSVSDEAVQDYYHQHQSRFMTPEQVSVRYLELSKSAIAAGINPDEAELRSYYQARKSNYVIPEQRRASHILIKLPKDADQAAVAAARKKLEQLKQQLAQGADFAKLAREYSQDPGSAKQGGDLGFFSRGTMDEALEKVVFSMKPGEVSGPVRTPFGLHLVKLTAVKPAETETFDQAKAEVLREYRREKAESIYADQAEKLANLTFENPNTLSVAAQALGLKVKEAGPFSRAGSKEGIASDRKVVQAAFGSEVLENSYNSQALDLGGDRLVVLRVKDHQPPRQQTLDEVRDRIVATLQADAARSKAQALGEELIGRLRDGGDPHQLAADHKLEWGKESEVGRDARDVAQPVLRALFAMSKPVQSKTVYEGLTLDAGDFTILALSRVTDGDPKQVPAQRRDAVREALARGHGQRAYQAYVQALRAQADIVIHDENL
jgi:peptidyl-prolyl cis-trans isomerase D